MRVTWRFEVKADHLWCFTHSVYTKWRFGDKLSARFGCFCNICVTAPGYKTPPLLLKATVYTLAALCMSYVAWKSDVSSLFIPKRGSLPPPPLPKGQAITVQLSYPSSSLDGLAFSKYFDHKHKLYWLSACRGVALVITLHGAMR